MTSFTTALVSAGCIIAGSLFGIWLKKHLPSHHLDESSKDTIKVGTGILATLAALVLGLLIGSAKSTFDAASVGLSQGSAKIILLNRTLTDYGPEALPARKLLRDAVVLTEERVWTKRNVGTSGSKGFEMANGMEQLQGVLRALTPQTKPQEGELAQAIQLCSEIAQTRWFLVEQQNPLPMPLVVILVLWLSLLHISMGLFAPRNGTVVTVMIISGLYFSSALFLAMEMNRPFDGIMMVSDAPVRKALEFISE